MSDVTVSITGVTGIAPIGVAITYAINQIPTCAVIMDPSNSPILQDPDAQKRVNTCNIGIKIKSANLNDSLTFKGLFDGVSIAASVGGMQYSAIFKNQFQLVVEAYTKIPGLNAMGINPFQRPTALFKYPPDGLDPQNYGLASIYFGQGLSLDAKGLNPFQFYLEVAKTALKVQTTDLKELTGTANDDSASITNIITLLMGTNYQDGAEQASFLLNEFDTRVIDQIPAALTATPVSNANFILNTYLNNSEFLWDNLRDFFNSMGLNLIVSNNKVFIVPDNGFVTMDRPDYTQGATGGINQALPAQYGNYTYNDNGYKDIGAVALIREYGQTGNSIGSFLPMYCGGYASKDLVGCKSGGLVILRQHPFMFYDSAGMNEQTNFAVRTGAMTSDMPANYPAPGSSQKTYSSGSSEVVKTLKSTTASNGDILTVVANNYAQIKFFQLRYGDRTGSIIMEFDSGWAPGTCGTIYLKETATYLDFFVQSVTHEVSVAAPTSGTALTIVNFSCGRMGTESVSVADDQFFQYTTGVMKGIQSDFVADIK